MALSDDVQKLYIAYFNRPADVTGLAYWVDQATKNGGSTAAVANAFSASAEYKAIYAGLSSAQIINTIYQNLFGRGAEPAGLSYWALRLDNGTFNIGNIALSVMQGAQNADATAVASKATAAAAFTNGLTTSAQILAYSGDAANAVAKTWLAGVVDATTLTTAQGSLTTTIGNITNTTVANGQTFTLTTGIDSLTGTTGNDTFNAPAGTFGSLDSVDGGTGTADTLNIAATAAFSTPVNTNVKNVEVINLSDSTGGVTFNTSTGYTGLTTLNVNNAAGAANITTAGTTAVTVTNSTPGGAATTVNGGTSASVTVTSAGSTAVAGATSADTVTVGTTTAPTGAITVSVANALVNGGAGATTTAGAINIKGGTTVTVTETQANAASTGGTKAAVGDTTLGAIGVTGTSTTTSVSVTETAAVTGAAAVANVANTSNAVAAKNGIVNGQVDIADANATNSTTATASTLAGTIASVTLANYGTANVSSAALNSLTLSGTGTAVNLVEGGSTAATNTTLALNLNGGSVGTVTDNSNQFKTINAALTANTTLTQFADTAARTLALSGTGVLTYTTANTALTSITLAGAAGLNSNISGVSGVTAIDASNTTGAMTLTLNAANQSFKGGSGKDVITISADATKTITLGSGTTDQLILAANGSTFTTTNTGANVTGYEQLGVAHTGAGASWSYDLSKFASGVNALEVTSVDTTGAYTVTFTKVAAGTTLQLDAASTNAGNGIVYQTADTAGATDSVAVTLKGTTVSAANGGGTAGYTTNALTLQDANAVGIGNVTITTDASVYQGLDTITTLTDSALTNLTIAGTGSLSITAASTGATSLTIADNGTGTSATADGIVTLGTTANALGNLSYSGTHAFTIGTLNDNVANATITNANTGTSGVLTIGAWTDANLASLTLNGSIALTGTFALNGAATITGTNDNSNVSITASGGGVKTITLGNGTDTVVTGAAADVLTLGTGANTVTAGAGADTIKFGTHTGVDKVIQAAAGDSGSFATPGTNTISTTGFDVVTGVKAGDIIQLAAYTGGVTAATDLNLSTANATSATTLVGLGTTANADYFVRGTYDSVGKTFVGSATGADTLFVYDGNAVAATTAQEAIVLVGYVAQSVTGVNAATGLVTLA